MTTRTPDLPTQLRSVALRYVPRAAISPWRRAAPGGISRTASPPSSEGAKGSGPSRRDIPAATVEALLLISPEPITGRRLSQVAGLADPTAARTVIRRLNDFYERDQCPYRIEEVAGGWQLLTHPSFGGWLRRINSSPAETRLSTPALETLAVVAYRQPVLRAEVESIRGVQSSEMLRQLMDRDLVRIVGRSNDLGRPFLYGTTQCFLQAFGLRNLEDLPRADQLRAHGPADRQITFEEPHPGHPGDQELTELVPDLKEEQHQ